MSNQIYLSNQVCEELGLDYWEKEPKETRLYVGNLLYYRKEWDSPHREIFAKFLLEDRLIHVRAAKGPGWYDVLNLEDTTVKYTVELGIALQHGEWRLEQFPVTAVDDEAAFQAAEKLFWDRPQDYVDPKADVAAIFRMSVFNSADGTETELAPVER